MLWTAVLYCGQSNRAADYPLVLPASSPGPRVPTPEVSLLNPQWPLPLTPGPALGALTSPSPPLACRELLSSDAMKEYNRARVYLDENYKSQEHFTVSPHPASVTVQGAGSVGTWRRSWEGQAGGVEVAPEFPYCPWAPQAVAEVRLCHTQEGISGCVEPHAAARVAPKTEWG